MNTEQVYAYIPKTKIDLGGNRRKWLEDHDVGVFVWQYIYLNYYN